MGEVRRLWIPGPAGRLEAALRGADPPRGLAVLAHPHPLQGGTLHNPVVFHADRALNREGLVTLRLNFRGVGTSEGRHDAGRGEVGDVGAAVSWLRGLGPGLPLVLVGYSFGSWCAIRHAATDPRLGAVVAIGLPLHLYAFEEVAQLKPPLAVVQGELDELGTPEEVRRLTARVLVVPGATHLFSGRAPEAAARVSEAVLGLLGTGTD